MNIIVLPSKIKEFYFKPDSSLVRGSKDYFPPDYVKEISVALSVVIRVLKSAKYISEKFSERYYNDIGFGLIIYPENMINSNFANVFASGRVLSTDNTAFVTEKFFPFENIENREFMTFTVNDKPVFNNYISSEIRENIGKAIEYITKYTTLKSGDLIFMELTDRVPVNIGDNLEICYSDKACLNFSIR